MSKATTATNSVPPARKVYTDEFKREAVRLAQERGNQAQTARELGLSDTVLQRWKKALQAMATKIMDIISREEFDRRLDAYNERRHNKLQRIEAQQTQVETVLTHYEQMLDDIEAGLTAKDQRPSHATPLRQRLQELANKTTEVAALL